jgi:hypothetical protein
VKCLPGVRSDGRPAKPHPPATGSRFLLANVGHSWITLPDGATFPRLAKDAHPDGRIGALPCPIVKMPNFGRGQSVADACKGTRIARERREAPSSHYLPGAGEGSSDRAAPFHPSGDGSPGVPDGGGRGSGSPVHRGPRHQQGAWRPTGARVLRLRPTSWPVRGRSGRSGRMVVSRRRAERRLRSLGRSARQPTTGTSFSPKLIRPLARAADCPDLSPITTG